MKQSTGNRSFLAELFYQNYRRSWTSERDYRLLSTDDYSTAIYDLRQRAGLTHDQLAFLCGGASHGKNIINLERLGKPIHADMCAVFAGIATDYGLPKLSEFFRSCGEYKTRTKTGRSKEDANETVWI